MPFKLKKVWVSPSHEADLASVSLESADPSSSTTRVNLSEYFFPKMPTTEHPIRHVVNLGYMDVNDLEMIYYAIQKYLEKR